MDVTGIAVDLAVVRWTLVACLAAVVALSLVRRHSARFARERAKRALENPGAGPLARPREKTDRGPGPS